MGLLAWKPVRFAPKPVSFEPNYWSGIPVPPVYVPTGFTGIGRVPILYFPIGVTRTGYWFTGSHWKAFFYWFFVAERKGIGGIAVMQCE